MTPNSTELRPAALRSAKLPVLVSGVLLLGLGIVPAFADTVQLKNGNVLEGRVTTRDGNYHIFVEKGNSVTVPGASVAKHTPGEAPVDAFHRRFAALKSGDREGLIELAAWGEEKGLRRTPIKAYREILRIDPHHAIARDRCGYVLHENRWVHRDQLEERGLVRRHGQWMTPEDANRLEEDEAVREFRALLADISHENKYLRQNAFDRIFKVKDTRLLPFLRKLLSKEDPIERMVAGRVLGNHSFDEVGQDLYEAFIRERRPQARHAFRAVLRRYGRAELGNWIARDIAAWGGVDFFALQNLLELFEACPHRDAVPAVIDLLRKRATQSLALDLLQRVLPSAGALDSHRAWSDWWREAGPRQSADLGRDWIKSKRGLRRSSRR